MNIGQRMWVLSLGALLALAGAAYAHGHDAKIAALNAKLKSSNAKWKAGATSISALSDDEFSSSLLSPEDIAASVKSAKSLKKMPPDTMQAAEAAVDWRAKGIETPVRKQGGCGSCWAFAMSGAEEQQLLIKKPGVYRKPGAEVQRSPQALVSCDTQMKGCKGGRLDASYLVGTGLPAESLYPYASGATGEAGACGAGATDQDWKSKTEKIAGWGSIDPSVSALKQAVTQYGPIPSSFLVFDDMKHYRSGVYTKTEDAKFMGGHAILIVGFDDTDQSFIVKNSWGTDWGESGYFKIAYSEVACDLTDLLVLHKKTNFGCMTITYDMDPSASFHADGRPLADEGKVKSALRLLDSPLPW